MHTTNLRKVGGSIMLAVPPALLDQLNLVVGSEVGLSIKENQLIIKPVTKSRPKYTLDELLAASDYSFEKTEEDREWLDAPAVGKEIL